MEDKPNTDVFIALLTEHQTQLRAFVLSSVGNHSDASDILQQVNIVLWQKSSELKSKDGFLPWALSVARFKVLSYVRDKSRDRLVFDPEVVDEMTQAVEQNMHDLPARQLALRECLRQASRRNLDLLRERYVDSLPLRDIATGNGVSVDSVKGLLKRVRRALADCVTRRLTGNGTPG